MSAQASNSEDTGVLVAAAAAGDSRAADELYRRYRPYLAFLTSPRIPRQVRDRFETDDVLQSAFLNAFEGLRDYTYVDEPSFKAWLRQIVVRKLADRIRMHKRQRRSAFDTLREQFEFETRPHGGSDGESPSVIMSRAETHAELLAAIQELPDEQRQTVVLRCFERRSFAQIGAELKLSEDQARRRYIDGLQALLQSLG